MAQYVQKVGGQAVDMSTLGYKTLQDAANAGYNPVAAPTTATGPVAPVSSTLSTSDLTNLAGATTAKQATVNNDSLLTNIQSTYDKYTGNAAANKEFVNGVVKYATGKDATAQELSKYTGQSLYNVVSAYNVGSKLSNFAQVEPPKAEEMVAPPKLSALDQKFEMMTNWSTEKSIVKAQAQQEEGITDIQKAFNDAQTAANEVLTKIEKAKADMDTEDILNEEAKIALKNKIEGQVIPMSEINKQLLAGTEDMEQAQRLDRLYDTYEYNVRVNEYNAKLRNVQLLQGQYQQAQENVKDNIDDWVEQQKMKLDILTEQGQLEKEERAKYEKEIDYERELGVNGYAYIEDMATYEKIVKDLGVTAATYNQFFYKDPVNGKIYLKPQEKAKAGGGGSSASEFTPDQKRKLEQKFGADWIKTTTRQQQLDFIYGEDAVEVDDDVNFYVQQLLDENSTYYKSDGSINWNAVPTKLRSTVQTEYAKRLLEEPANEGENDDNVVWDFTKSTAKAAGKWIANKGGDLLYYLDLY